MSIIEHRVEMTQAKIDRYGRINGDNDIIHYDHEYAVARGFAGTLAHGPHNMAPAAELGLCRHGADWFTQGRLRVRWIGPVMPGDVQVTVLAEDGTLEARVDERVVMVGSAVLR